VQATATLQDVYGRACPPGRSPAEWQVRCELAAAYRLFWQFGWHELIYNHITVRVPDTEHFLINPFGLLYSEVTASTLVKIDFEGRLVEPSAHPINPAGFVVHSAVHRARPDVACVVHTHTTAGQVVSCQRDGLLPLSFNSLFYADRIAYHDFEGITLAEEESERLAADLGDRNLMVLRNHGLLVCGPSVADAFADHYLLQRACEVQVAAQATGVPLIQPSTEVALHAADQFDRFARQGSPNRAMYEAMQRWMLASDPGFCR
jgi:ribulose-5-phosphate 4-epimerase/fuculose-1-phosphate aldolase